MVHLTRLNRSPLVINSDLIEHIDVTPDTLIALTTGEKILVLETAAEVVERVVGFRRALLEGMPSHCACPRCDDSPGLDKKGAAQACFDPMETSLA
jgi:flagellar protein FlbD